MANKLLTVTILAPEEQVPSIYSLQLSVIAQQLNTGATEADYTITTPTGNIVIGYTIEPEAV